MLSQGCPAVGFPTRISIRNSYENLAPSYRENTLVSKQLPCQVIAFIGYRCPASSEAFPLRLPSPVYHVLTCIHRKRSHAPEETGAVTVIQSFGDIRASHRVPSIRKINQLSCQAELLDSPMAASFIRSVNVGQNESDTKEFHKNLNFFISLFQRSLFKPFHQDCHGQLLGAGWWSTGTALHLILF